MKTVLSTNVENLKKDQLEFLRSFVSQRLDYIKMLVNEGDCDKLEKALKGKLGYSPAGDCMGCDNTYINFSDCGDDTIQDIGDVFKKIKELQGYTGL